MMELNVSKRTMMRLIREHKDQIGVPIPQPNCKEVRFTAYEYGNYVVSWRIGKECYTFELTNRLTLWCEIINDGQLELRRVLSLDRDWLTGLGILNDREEGLACQG